MKTVWKTALAALAVTAGSVAAMPASAQSFGLGFGPEGGIRFSYDSGGYCDPFGCPDDFWDMPVYYGAVFWHGAWYDGPVYYREAFGRRQFWIHGDWRNDEWRGPRPGWWREGRYGPPLGVDYYRSHGFHGRWDRGGYDRRDYRDYGRDNGRGIDQRDSGRGFDQRGSDRNDGGRGFNPRDSNQGTRGGALDQRSGPQPQAAPQQPQRQYGNPPPPGFQPRNGAYGHYDRPNPAPAPAPAPAAAPAPAPAPAAAPPAAAPPAGTPPDGRRRDH